MTQPHFVVVATTLDAPDAPALASFYEKLLGWERVTDKPQYVGLRPRGGGTRLAFQTERNYVARSGRANPVRR